MTEQFSAVNLRHRLSPILINIAKRLVSRDDIAKLLAYNSSNALDLPVNDSDKIQMLYQDDSNPNRRIFFTPLSPGTTTEEVQHLRVHFQKIAIDLERRTYRPYILIDVVCHQRSVFLDGESLRHIYLLECVHDALNGYNCGLIDCMECLDIQEWALNNQAFLGYTLKFTCGEFRL